MSVARAPSYACSAGAPGARLASRSWRARAVVSAIVFTTLSILSACSGNGGDGTTSAAGGAAGAGDSGASRCLESCQADARCQGFPASGCTGSIACHGWPGDAWRGEVADAYLACLHSCPSDPEACSNAAFDAAGAPRSVDTAYASACESKRASCAGSFPNDACGEQSLYLETAVASAMACLDQPCAMAAACIDAAFE